MQLLRAQAGFATGAVLATVHHRWIRQAVAIGIGAWFIWALYGRLDEFSLDTVFGGLSRISALQWITAALTTALSFLAVSGYDVVIGRSLGYRYRACDLARTGLLQPLWRNFWVSVLSQAGLYVGECLGPRR